MTLLLRRAVEWGWVGGQREASVARLACSPLVRVGLALLAHVVGSGLTEMEPPHRHLRDLLRGKIDPVEDGKSAQAAEKEAAESRAAKQWQAKETVSLLPIQALPPQGWILT